MGRAAGVRMVGIGLVLALMLAPGAGCAGQDRAITAAELGAMIDSILPEIAEVSGMPVVRPVRYELQSREEARAFLERQLDEELGGGEGRAMERAYKAFGLLPDTLDLRGLMLELLTEQVVGYYDPPTDRLYVLEGATAAVAEPVVAHELVHALQNQHTDLEAIVAPERGNDRQVAAQAAAEGQAMIVMLALQAARTTGQPMDPGTLPDLGPMMRPVVEAENSRFPVFRAAPRIIQETLLFPYISGATFVQALFRHTRNGPPVPFGELLPQSTEQVMDPARRFLDERDAPTELRLGPARGDWSVVYENTLGQLETAVLMAERLGLDIQDAAHGWDGDRYALLEAPAGEALVWYTVWDDDAAADRFAARYRRWADSARADPGPGFGPGTLDRLETDGRPVVRIVETPSGVDPSAVGTPRIEELDG